MKEFLISVFCGMVFVAALVYGLKVLVHRYPEIKEGLIHVISNW